VILGNVTTHRVETGDFHNIQPLFTGESQETLDPVPR
jgi:hypothetical protein